MTQPVVTAGSAPAPKSLPARFIGIITSPRATFDSVAANPKWFGMLALTTVAMTVLVAGFLATKVGQDAWVEAATASRSLSPEQAAGVERIAPYAMYFSGVPLLILVPLFSLVFAGILFAIFNAALGGEASFKQVFTVSVHAGPIGVLSQLFAVPLNYYRETMTSAANLGVLLPMLDVGDKSFAGHLLGSIDLFLVWQLVVLAIGLGVLYKRRTQPIAISLLCVYAVIAVVIALVKSRA